MAHVSNEPLVVDPTAYDKGKALEAGLVRVDGFLEANHVAPVRGYVFEPGAGLAPPGRNVWHDKGWYWDGVVFVNLKRSRCPVRVPGFAWSYTGFKADLTAPGVLAHEVGHHVHRELEKASGSAGVLCLLRALAELALREAPVSGYEPNEHEVMAEACRLFILNPELLRAGRPARFSFLTGLGLRPLHSVPWQDVLRNAHPRVVAAAVTWIGKKQR